MEGDGIEIQNMMVLDEDVKKKISIKYDGGQDNFVIKALFPKDHKNIARALAIQYNGLPVNSFSMDDRAMFEQHARVDQGVIESPGWWKSAEDCLKPEVVSKLDEEIIEWTGELHEKLKKNKFTKRSSEG